MELLAVSLFKIFHLAQHHELFFIDDLLCCSLVEHILLSELLISQSYFSLFLLAIKAQFQLINLFLVSIDLSSDCLDLLTHGSTRLSEACNSLLENLALFALFELKVSLLLVNSLSLFLLFWLFP